MAYVDTIKKEMQKKATPVTSFKGGSLPLSDAPSNVRAIPLQKPKSYIPWTESKELKQQESDLARANSDLARYTRYFERAEELSTRSPILRQAQMNALNKEYGITDEASYNSFVDQYKKLYENTESLIGKYNVNVDNEKTRYKLWQESLRPYEDVQKDIDNVDEEISQLKKEKVGVEGYFTSPNLKGAALTEESKKQSADLQAKIESAQKRRAELLNEKADSQNYYYSTLPGKSDFSEKSAEDKSFVNEILKHAGGVLETSVDLATSGTTKVIKTAIKKATENTASNLVEEHGTDEQKAIYRYLLNTQGKKAADDYAKYIKEDTTAQKASNIVKDTEKLIPVVEQLSKIKQSFDSGIEQFYQGAYSAVTGKETNPTAQQLAASEYINKTNLAGKVVYGLSQTIGNMTPSILLSTMTGVPALGNVSMGISAGGNAFSEAIKKGASKEEAYAYGTLIGLSESLLEKALGGIGKLGGGKIGTKLATKINTIDKAWLAISAKYGINIAREGIEEGLQTILEPIFQTMVLDEKYQPAKLSDVVYSATLGFLTAGIFEGAGPKTEYMNSPIDKKVIDEFIKKGEKAKENSLKRAIADDLKEKLAINPDAVITGFDVGRIAKFYKDTRKSEKAETKERKKTMVEMEEEATKAQAESPEASTEYTEFAEAVSAPDVKTVSSESEPENTTTVTAAAERAEQPEVKNTTPTVSRDGIEIKPETDPEIRSRLERATDDIERTGILSGASEETISTVRRLSNLFKTDIRFEVVPQIIGKDGMIYTENGRYNKDDKTIYINMAGNKSTYIQIISHEFTHSISGTKLYSELERYARERYKPLAGQPDFDSKAVRILKEYNAAEKEYNIKDANEEVVANYVSEELLNDETSIKRFVKENRTLAEKLKDIIDKVISVIGSDKIKSEAKTRVKLNSISKLLGEALKTRDSNTDKISKIKNRYNELVRKLQNNEIAEETYKTQLSELDKEASAMGLDLLEMMSGDSYSITAEKTAGNAIDTIPEPAEKKEKQILDHVRSNPKQERIGKLIQKSYDNSIKKVVEHRLPRNAYIRMRDAEILLTREIADAFSTPFKRNREYYYVIRDLVGEYVSTGKITQATLQQVANFLKINFGVKFTKASMDILKYRIHKIVESDLKFVRETYEYMLEQANAEPVEVKQSRLEKGYRVVERRIHDFRKWIIDELSINENQFADVDELIYKMLSHSENGVIPPAYLNEFFNKIVYYTKHEKSKSVVELIDWLKNNFHISSNNKEALSEMARILLTSSQNGTISDSNITSFLNAVYSAGEVMSSDVDLHLFFRYAKMSVDKHTLKKILENNEYDEFALSILGDIGDGISVSDMYDYLHSLRPELFPDDIFTEQEQAEYILSIAQESKPQKVSLEDTLSQKEKERLFKRAKDRVSKVVSQFEGKKYSEIRNSMNARAVDLARDVMFATNYAIDTASLAQAAIVEGIDTDSDKIETLYEKLKAERKKALTARGRTILREKDEKALRDLLEGTKTIEELSNEYNTKDIKTVYEASVEYERIKEQIRKYKEGVIRKRYEKADQILKDADINTGFRDHSIGTLYMTNTIERNIEWIGRRSITSKNMIDAYIKPVHEAVRKMTIEKNDIVKKINDLNLSRETDKGNTDSEAFAVQFVGEAEEAIKYLKRPMHSKEKKGGLSLEEWETLLNSFWLDNPNMDKDKIQNAIKVFREVYQKLFDKMNAARIRNGYEPVDYRSGYFPHFSPQGKDGLLSNLGKLLGIDLESDILPTEINGLTHIFKPNIPYMSSAHSRSENLQFETIYDAVEGMHRYLDPVLKVIYLTDSIGDLRALAQQIRYNASDEGRRESENKIRFRTDLDETQRQAAIDRIYEGGKYKLSNFVVDLEEYTNLLAGKKSKLDRTSEWAFGRIIYKLGKWISSRISSNMIGYNISSALTNYIPLTIAISELPAKYITQAASMAVASRHNPDGIEMLSTFIVNRKGADDLLKRWQLSHDSSDFLKKHKNIAKAFDAIKSVSGKYTEIGMKPMELIDLGISNVIVRAYYLYYLDQGMNETKALEAADDKARRIMADRSIGSMPTAFGATNPLIKLFTQFQLEVSNQIAYFAHDVLEWDIPKMYRDKKAKEIAISLLRYCIAAWLFNDLYEKLMGKRPALDPLGVFNDAVGDTTGVHVPNIIDLMAYAINPFAEKTFSLKTYYKEVPPWITQKMSIDNAVSNFTVEILQEIPFVGSLFGGGRLPAANALPDIGGTFKTIISDATPHQKLKKIGGELSTIGTYFLPPTGGGQISKTIKGVAAVSESGKYTTDNKGRKQLQYPITPSLFSVPKTLLFGPSSTSRGQEWIRTNFQNTLSWKETKMYDAIVDEGLTQDKAYDVAIRIKDAGNKKTQKVTALNNADIPASVKRVAYEQMFLTDSPNKQAALNALDNVGNYRDVVIDFMIEHPEASTQEEIMAIWGDMLRKGTVIQKSRRLNTKEKAAIIQVLTDTSNNPYWEALKNSVYYVVHPKKKLEDQKKKK